MARTPGRRAGGPVPGRDTPALRTAERPGKRLARRRDTQSGQGAEANEPTNVVAATVAPRLSHGVRLTRRAVGILVVLAILVISFISSLRVYIRQQQDIAVANQQIAERTQQITNLQDELSRWQDPEYVRTQARARLGWVVPGETGFRVVGPDGQPYGGGSEITRTGALPGDEHPPTWWQRVWGSVQAADQPVPVSPSPTPAPATISAPPTPKPGG